MKTALNIFTILVVALAISLTGRKCERESNGNQDQKTEVGRDTLVVVKTDTLILYKPQPYRVRDTVFLPTPETPDTTTVTQTRPTEIPTEMRQEVKEYRDSTYYAKISGINAFLEEIRFYPRTEYKYITNTEIIREKPKKWNLFVETETTITGNYSYLSVAAGLSCSKNRWVFDGSVGKDFLNNEKCIKARARYNIFSW